jgi:hypothetical protein
LAYESIACFDGLLLHRELNTFDFRYWPVGVGRRYTRRHPSVIDPKRPAALGIEWEAAVRLSKRTGNDEEWSFVTKSLVFCGLPGVFV